MADTYSFNDIHRGIPLISRAVVVVRLRDLQEQGIVEPRPRTDGTGSEYWLTPASAVATTPPIMLQAVAKALALVLNSDEF
jgi:DNA-binding HxlR family transcriptional regulator